MPPVTPIGVIELKGAIALTLAPPPAGKTIITTHYENFTVTAEGDHMSYNLPVDHLINVKVSYVDAKGNPAQVDGAVSWDTSDASIITVDPDNKDSTQCKLTPGGATGQAQVTASADADLGDGVRELVTSFDVTVIAGEAVAGTIAPVGEAEPIAPHPEQQQPRKR